MLTTWDALLIATVSIQSTVLAYVRDARWKAFLLCLPFPFTLAALAVGKPVDSTNVCGLLLILLFFVAVRWLYKHKVPIVFAIASGTALYSGLAILLAKVLPHDAIAFG